MSETEKSAPEAEPQAESKSGQPDLLDALLPENFDVMELVRTYPIPAVLLAALGGYALGRSKGDWVMGALSTFAAAQITRQVNQLLGDQLLGGQAASEES